MLGAPYQIAQKLHACTTVATDGRPNDRAHDLGDLILLDELTEFSLAETHAACVEIFQLRSMHEWPPSLVVWSHWPELWDEIVRIDSFPVSNIEDAAARVRSLIERIAASGTGDSTK